jgi:peptide/nickel transport system substrate-binding protein
MKRVVTCFLMLVFIGSYLLLAPSEAQTAEIKRGGTITVGIDAGPIGWDPHKARGISSPYHYEQVYESLLRYNYRMEMEPSLATSWEQPNPLTLIFHLRKGVKFHNGQEMTADDVKYSFDRWRDPKISLFPTYYGAVKSIEVLDRYTVKFDLSMYDTSLLPIIAAGFYSSVVPREMVEKHGDLMTVTCGTGPFKVKEYVPGDYTIYERNPEYWMKGFPRVDQVIFKVIKDENSRLAALRMGTVDIAWLKEPQMAKTIQKTKGLKVITPPPFRQMRFWLNEAKPPFNNKKLRQAVSCALNRKEVINTVYMGYGEITSCIPPGMVPYALPKSEVAKLPFYKRDLKLSKRLLKEAGYPNGFEFTTVASDFGFDGIPGAQVIQSSLKDAGIKMNIQQVDWAILLKRWRGGDFEGLMMGGKWDPTPDIETRARFYSTSPANYGRYKNPELDKLLDESRVTQDEKRRIEIWKKIQYIMAEDAPILWVAASPAVFEVVRDYVKGYHFLPHPSRIYLRDAWLDK